MAIQPSSCTVLATNSTDFSEQTAHIGISDVLIQQLSLLLHTVAILKAYSLWQREPLCGNLPPVIVHHFAWLEEVYERVDNPLLGVHCQEHTAHGGVDSRKFYFSVLFMYRPFDRGRLSLLTWAMSLLDFL
jgi:hypothetical protein